MDKTKKHFTINDLEILSGIKPHTIRIWEKRYNLFTPVRQSRNRRLYEIHDLKKLLNVSYLINENYKISSLAKLQPQKLHDEVVKIGLNNLQFKVIIDQLIYYILDFDEQMVVETLKELEKEYSFEFIYENIIRELLSYINLLWQTSKFTSIHKHFIFCIIKQRIHHKTLLLSQDYSQNEKTYILFTPDSHDSGLEIIFLHYKMRLKNLRSIYLGEEVPSDLIKLILNKEPNATPILYFGPDSYLGPSSPLFKSLNKNLQNSNIQIHLIHSKSSNFESIYENIINHKTTKDFIKKITKFDEM